MRPSSHNRMCSLELKPTFISESFPGPGKPPKTVNSSRLGTSPNPHSLGSLLCTRNLLIFCEMRRRGSKPQCQTQRAHFHTQLIFIQIMGEKLSLVFAHWQPALPSSGLTKDCLPEPSQENTPAHSPAAARVLLIFLL